MVNYEVTVHTGDRLKAGTYDNVYIRLVGLDEKSKLKKLTSKDWFNWLMSPFRRAKVSSFTVSCHEHLGKLVWIELYKESGWLPSGWFVDKVEIRDPEGKTYIFPIYQWISDEEEHCFREGAALRVFDDINPLSRKWELAQRKIYYQ